MEIEGSEFKVILNHVPSLRPAWVIWDLSQKEKNKNNNKIKNAVLGEKEVGSLDREFQTLVTKLKPIFINHNIRNNYNQHIFAYNKCVYPSKHKNS